MTPRERVMAAGLGLFLAAGVFGGGGYLLVLGPLAEKAAQEATLRAENDGKDQALARIKKDLQRLPVALKRSLPADADLARQEYDAAITRLLEKASVPAASFTVKPQSVDPKAAPELPRAPAAPNVPRYAYTKVALVVTLKKVDLATLIDVLGRYYKLNLLHQITKFNVKKLDTGGRGAESGDKADKADLDVTFTTEAVSAAGAEARRALLPVSEAFAAAGGGAGFQTLSQSAQAARGLTPLQLTRVLAAGDRDYSLVLVKDIFHGPPPPAPPPPAPEPKDDTAGFIRLTGLARNPDGTGTAFITDAASRQEYVVDVTLKDGAPAAAVVKSYYTPKGAKKSFDPEPEIDISEATSSTKRRFRVHGLAADGLVVGQKGVGGADQVFLWPTGETLARVREVSGAAKDDLVRAAGGG